MTRSISVLVAAVVALGGCDANQASSPPGQTASPSTTASPSSHKTSVPRCSQDIPFEPTHLPNGFGHERFSGRFPGGRPLDDPRSTGGKRYEEQVVVHYRGSGSRAIEIRRPGTIFSELAQRDDAPTIEVLGTETTGFAPIAPGGNEFIVSFRYPPGARPHEWCSLYSLNEYGVSLTELKKVARSLVPTDRCLRYPPPFEATYLPDGFSDELRPSAGLFKGTTYPTEGLLGHYIGPRETIHVNFQVKGGPLPYQPGLWRPLRVLDESAGIGKIEGGYAVEFTNGKCDFRMDTYGITKEQTVRVATGLQERS